MAVHPPLLILQISSRRQKYPYALNYNNRPRRGKFVQLFIKILNRHAVFTTLLRLDATFTTAVRPGTARLLTGIEYSRVRDSSWMYLTSFVTTLIGVVLAAVQGNYPIVL